MGILAVAQLVSRAFEREVDVLRQGLVRLQPRDDLRVERRRTRERRDRERSPGLVADGVVVAVEFFQQAGVLRGVGDDRDEGVVLRCRADHGGTTDVDGFDVGGLRERIEVRHDEVEGFDPVRGEVLVVRRLGPVGKDAAVDLRVEGDDPVIENGWHAGDVVDRDHGDARVGDRLGRAAGGNELDAAPLQLAREVDDPGLVVHREQRPRDLRAHHSTNFRSTSG